MKNKIEKKKPNIFMSGLMNIFFDLIKHFIKDAENIRKVKKIDHFDDKFSELEHMFIRLEDKINDYRKQIDELKNRILWGNIIVIVLLIFVLIELIR
jgi:hypothetical protein